LAHQVTNRYWPRQFDEIEGTPVSWLNEPVPPPNVSALVQTKQRSLHAILVETLNSTRALLRRLEAGVTVPRQEQREVVRLLYVAAQHQAKALAAVLELDGLK
jgi:hypothetical protein